MDFGFGRFLEMFEERFGRTASTILLAMIGLAVFGFSVTLIVDNIIAPIFALIKNWNWAAIRSFIEEDLTASILTMLAVGAVGGFVGLFALSVLIRAAATAMLRRINKTISEYARVNDELERRMAEIDKRFGPLNKKD